jgi:hypothetical protein
MTLLRLIQRASILAGITAIGLSIPNSPAKAEISEVCIIASNGKTVCGKQRSIERMCVTTDGSNNICGKFKSAKEEKERGGEEQEEARTPAQNSGYRKEAGGVTYLLRNCKVSGRDRRNLSYIKCNFVLTVKRDNQVGHMYTGSGKASITDSAGNTYPSSEVLDYNGGEIYGFSNKMSTGIDYVIDLYFPVEKQLGKLSLLSVMVEKDRILQFRNIPVSN